jgi:hypothetical protein
MRSGAERDRHLEHPAESGAEREQATFWSCRHSSGIGADVCAAAETNSTFAATTPASTATSSASAATTPSAARGHMGADAANGPRATVCRSASRYHHPALARSPDRRRVLCLPAVHRPAHTSDRHGICAVRGQHHRIDQLCRAQRGRPSGAQSVERPKRKADALASISAPIRPNRPSRPSRPSRPGATRRSVIRWSDASRIDRRRNV